MASSEGRAQCSQLGEGQELDPAAEGLISPLRVGKELYGAVCYSSSMCVPFPRFFMVLAFPSLFLSPGKGFLAYAWRVKQRRSLQEDQAGLAICPEKA